jgi:hypothetical protein
MGEVRRNADADRQRVADQAQGESVNATDPISALLAHLGGEKELTPEHIALWRSALAELKGRGKMRDKLDAFAKHLEVKPKRGRRREIVVISEQARRANAILAFKAAHDDDASRRLVAEKHGYRASDLAKWSRDRKVMRGVRAWAASELAFRESLERGIADVLAYDERRTSAAQADEACIADSCPEMVHHYFPRQGTSDT